MSSVWSTVPFVPEAHATPVADVADAPQVGGRLGVL